MKNFKGFRPLFNQAGEYCNLCFLAFEYNERESRKQFQGLANNSLANIIKSCEYKETREIAKGAIKVCIDCKYRDPNIFNYLESNGFNFR